MKSNSEYAECSFLIYNSWTSLLESGGSIAGSLLIDGAYTEEEAINLVAMYKERAGALYQSRYVYITNKKEWWHRT